MFHYRNHGAAYGGAGGIQVPPSDKKEFQSFSMILVMFISARRRIPLIVVFELKRYRHSNLCKCVSSIKKLIGEQLMQSLMFIATRYLVKSKERL